MPDVNDAAQLIDKWADKLGEAVSAYGPQATELALEVGRIGAAKELAVGTATVVASAVSFTILFRKIIPAMKREGGKSWSQQNEGVMVGGIIASVVLIAFGVIAGGSGISRLINPFHWVGLHHPEIYLAAKALGL